MSYLSNIIGGAVSAQAASLKVPTVTQVTEALTAEVKANVSGWTWETAIARAFKLAGSPVPASSPVCREAARFLRVQFPNKGGAWLNAEPADVHKAVDLAVKMAQGADKGAVDKGAKPAKG